MEENMNISVLGTGMVGQTITTKLASIGHKVMVGSRDRKNPKALEWIKKLSNVSLGTFAESAAFGEMIFNCTLGSASLAALTLASEKNIDSKILIDTSNPLDFSKQHEVSLFICNTESLSEQIQQTFPKAKVVKTLNTLTASLMVNQGGLPGKHNLFLCGNDEAAKRSVRFFLRDSFGWAEDSVLDLGDITAARATEMYVMVWVRLWQYFQNPVFNLSILPPPNRLKAPGT